MAHYDELSVEQMRASVRAKGKDPKVTKKVWVAPEVEDFAQGRVLAFDQTLGKTGWSLVTVSDRVTVICGLYVAPTPEDLKGFEQTFWRAEWMGVKLEERVLLSGVWVSAVVHEMPSVGGKRIESSLMAAREIRRGAAGFKPVFMINRQSAYATMTGDRHAPKSAMTAAVERLVAPEDRVGKYWNQDIHDSIGLALKHLHNQRQEQVDG